MDEEEGGRGMLGKKKIGAGEVDFKEKSGTAWSHSYLNQKPWHPLSYPNQRRKWIAEQTNAQRQRRAEEVAREFAQEQEFFRQNALISKKEKEKVEMMKAVSFMYVRPPGYNAESAKAAELEDERKQTDPSPQPQLSLPQESSFPGREKKKQRPKDVFGRALPTEEEFEVLKNAPRMDTGLPARVKPFGVEVRNVKCARCGAFGHQSGDRECPLKDAIMPNEQSRLKRDDPLTSILAHTELSEPLKWELKQKPGISPPRGGFKPDDPNQQIVAEEIFDEYGGFLGGGGIPELLTSFSLKKSRKHSRSKSKHKDPLRSPFDSDAEREKRPKKEKPNREKHKKQKDSDLSDTSDSCRNRESRRLLSIFSSFDNSEKDRFLSPSYSDAERERKSKNEKVKRVKHKQQKKCDSSDNAVFNRHHRSRRQLSPLSADSNKDRLSPSDSDADRGKMSKKEKVKREKQKEWNHSDSSYDSDFNRRLQSRRRPSSLRSSDYSDRSRLLSPSAKEKRSKKEKLKREKHNRGHSDSSEDSDFSRHRVSRSRPCTLRSPVSSEKYQSSSPPNSEFGIEKRSKRDKLKREKYIKKHSDPSDSLNFNRYESKRGHSSSSPSDDSDYERDHKRSNRRQWHHHNHRHWHHQSRN